MTAFALAGARIFDGAQLRDGQAVIVADGRVRAVVKDADVPADVPVRRVEGLLAPGFIDIQVNGGGGVLLNDAPTVDGIRTIAEAHRRYGTTGLLPTLITDTSERMARGDRRRPRRDRRGRAGRARHPSRGSLPQPRSGRASTTRR